MVFTDTCINSSSFYCHECFYSKDVNLKMVAFSITNTVLLLPLSIYTLYFGVQRWRSLATTSHCDIFTYHMVAMEIIGVLGSVCFCCGFYFESWGLLMWGFYACSIILPGHSHFHILTCVDRYMAVVHPVMYLRMKSRGMIRNVIIGTVWLLCLGWVGFIILLSPNFPIIPFLCLFLFTLLVVCFCNVCVLCVLIRPGPGHGYRIDPSKQKAFHTVISIMGVLLFKFIGLLVCLGISLRMGSSDAGCMLLLSVFWLCLPSSFVLPLLFLHKVGKLACCHSKTGSG